MRIGRTQGSPLHGVGCLSQVLLGPQRPNRAGSGRAYFAGSARGKLSGWGTRVKTTDALGKETMTAYYANGLPQTITDAKSNVTSFTYDAYGYPATVTNAENETMTFSYDVSFVANAK